MRKRFVTTLIVCLAAVLCAVGLAACGNTTESLAGKTYEYYDLTLEFSDGTDEEIKNQYNAGIDTIKALYNGSTMVFEDGEKFTMTFMGQTASGTYTVSGNVITMKDGTGKEEKCTLAGDVITAKQEVSGIITVVKYKLKTNA